MPPKGLSRLFYSLLSRQVICLGLCELTHFCALLPFVLECVRQPYAHPSPVTQQPRGSKDPGSDTLLHPNLHCPICSSSSSPADLLPQNLTQSAKAKQAVRYAGLYVLTGVPLQSIDILQASKCAIFMLCLRFFFLPHLLRRQTYPRST